MTDLERRCIDLGVKMTAPRKTILRVLHESGDHPSVDSVYERAKAIDPSVGIATVYRTLSMLEEMELIARHEFNETFARYETNTDNHHHLIDIDTGEVFEFESKELDVLKVKLAEEMGFDLVDQRFELYGRRKSLKNPSSEPKREEDESP